MGMEVMLLIIGLFLMLLIGILFITQKGFGERITQQNQAVHEIRSILDNQFHLHERLMQDTARAVENIRTEYEVRKQFDEANRKSLARLEEIIAGSKSKGIAGENILREALRVFPPDMVVTGFKVRGKEAEFGLVLANKKIVPIDSKWPSTDLTDILSKIEDENERARVAEKIQKELAKRIQEVAQYIDPNLTSPWAIAAVPDSVYAICGGTHLEAYKKGVILISYSMAIPYLLTLFNLHLQYASTIDLENLQHYLMDIKRCLDEMQRVLETKIEKSVTTIDNASSEYRQLIGSMRGSILTLESSKEQRSSERPCETAPSQTTEV